MKKNRHNENKIGIVAYVPEPWNETWMARHQFLSRLAANYRILWCPPPRPWREVWTPGRLFDIIKGNKGQRASVPMPNGLTQIEQDRIWPLFFKPTWWADWLADRRMNGPINQLKREGCTKILRYFWRYTYAEKLEVSSKTGLLYHIVDEYSFLEKEHPIPLAELDLIRRADGVIIHSPALLEKKGRINPFTYELPNGVDYRAFSNVLPEPLDLAKIPHPRLGYCGNIKRQLDLDLLLKLASGHPEWQFVLVGKEENLEGEEAVLGSLKAQKNVHFLGFKQVFELPAYTQHFDVCMLPYRKNAYTRYIYPLKLHEYLSTGRPVIGTPIETLLKFADTISLADGAENWEKGIASLLLPEANALPSELKRKSIAQEHDWDALTQKLSKIIEEVLDRAYPT